MAPTPQDPHQPAPKQATSQRPGWLVKMAGAALAAIVDAEWLTARNPRYALESISLATIPTALSARHARLSRRPSVGRQDR